MAVAKEAFSTIDRSLLFETEMLCISVGPTACSQAAALPDSVRRRFGGGSIRFGLACQKIQIPEEMERLHGLAISRLSFWVSMRTAPCCCCVMFVAGKTKTP
jgi:hypothetical protein